MEKPLAEYNGDPTTMKTRAAVAFEAKKPLEIVDMYMTGKIEIDPMITHVMGLEEINKAFDLMHAGESIRSVVVF